MKSNAPLLLAALFATSCQQDVVSTPSRDTSVSLAQQMTRLNEAPNSVKAMSTVALDGLANSREVTKFRVFLQGVDGQALAADASVQPNTSYRVVVEGEASAHFMLKTGEDFVVLKSPPATADTQAVYLIKTTADVSPKLYLSIVPLKREQSALTKGRAVGFLLPQ